jgi:hypothetical protein
VPDHHAFLCSLADTLSTALAGGWESALVHVVPKPEGPDVGFLPLEGRAPADLLLGTVAPPEWSALGCAVRGRARSLTGDGPAWTADVVVIVPRSGDVVGRVRHGGQVITEPPAYGLTVDCLQRALGLPTAPAQVPAAYVLALLWLHDVADGRLADADEAFVLLTWASKGSLDWERLRQLVAAGRWPEPTLMPDDAAWLDAGAFSRWILSERPSLADMLADVAAAAGPAEAQRCAGVLGELGLDVPAFSSGDRASRRRRRAGAYRRLAGPPHKRPV